MSMEQQQDKKFCVIGCGSSGMPMVKALVDRDISFDCFEAGDEIGGNWAINNSNGMSAAYESLRINTSREAMEYADLPMSAEYPVYPSHHEIKEYFNEYFSTFDLSKHVTFNTRVEHCEQNPDGSWNVKCDNGETKNYEQLIVANGHHWDPRWPEPAIPGSFNGLVMHSHSYLSPFDPVDFSGKNIVIVGMGNSAMDIACELSQASLENTVYLSIRNSAWVLPRFLFGQPLGGKSNFFPPWRILSAITELVLRITHGTPMAHGLPKPNHRALQSHPTISQHIYDKLDQGEVLAKATIAELHGDRVKFTDGSEVEADVIIYATGYQVSFPFFAENFISAPSNELPLWQHMVKPDVQNLFFIGLMQPLGAIMPLAEKQAKLIGDVLLRKIKLPSLNDMLESVQQEAVAMRNRYVNSVRHTMQVDAPHYDKVLDKIRANGLRAATQEAKRLNEHGKVKNSKSHTALPVGSSSAESPTVAKLDTNSSRSVGENRPATDNVH